MAIVTVSRGSYSKGKEIAERVATRLGFECLSREVILEASEQFNIPEIKLVRAIHDAPSILERLTITKASYVAAIRVALLRHLARDNVVYHGLAGHFLVASVPHALKLRIIADWEDRVRLEMARNAISRREAEHLLAEDDEQRRRWSLHVHGVDPSDPTLYDMLLHIGRMSVDDAVEVICHTVRLDRFSTTPASRQAMADILLAAEVQVAIMEIDRDVEVSADHGVVYLRPARGGTLPESSFRALERRALPVPGVTAVESRFNAHGRGEDYSNPWYKI
jgi:cytidylate kinase